MSTTDNKYTDKRHKIAKDPKKKLRNKFILFGILTISFIFLIVLFTGYVIRYVIPQGKIVVQVGEIKYNKDYFDAIDYIFLLNMFLDLCMCFC